MAHYHLDCRVTSSDNRYRQVHDFVKYEKSKRIKMTKTQKQQACEQQPIDQADHLFIEAESDGLYSEDEAGDVAARGDIIDEAMAAGAKAIKKRDERI